MIASHTCTYHCRFVEKPFFLIFVSFVLIRSFFVSSRSDHRNERGSQWWQHVLSAHGCHGVGGRPVLCHLLSTAHLQDVLSLVSEWVGWGGWAGFHLKSGVFYSKVSVCKYVYNYAVYSEKFMFLRNFCNFPVHPCVHACMHACVCAWCVHACLSCFLCF